LVLTYGASNAESCTLSASPTLWPGDDPASVDCAGSYQATLSPASAATQWTFSFTAVNAAGISSTVTQIVTESAPAVTLAATRVSLALTSDAVSGLSSSLAVNYLGSLSSSCTYSDGTNAPCAVPAGTLSFEIDGADSLIGNYSYLSSSATNCTQVVGASVTGGGCNIDWSTYGDQWVTATFTSPGSTSTSQTVEVDVKAPVDLGAGLAYSSYQNAGADAIGDCTMASVGDWIETTLGTTPSESSIVGAYWSAEDGYNAGADDGLTDAQLFSYWTTDGIAGTHLVADQAVSGQSAIETDLSGGEVHINSLVLPADFPAIPGGGAHMWILVGYSSYGPMVVTWGEEFQISWADLNAWAEGIYSIGASS
jgi:hypothetical protein